MPKLLVIGYVWPEPSSSAAGKRMMQLLEFFVQEDYSICFATTAQKSPYTADLEALGIQTQAIALNDPSFDTFIQQFQPEVVLFDRFMMEEQFGWRVQQHCAKALRILDTEDLHFLRKARQAAAKSGAEISTELLQSDTAKREIASIYRCDLSLIISEKEMELLIKDFSVPAFLLYYLPLLGSLPDVREELPTFEQRKDFVSIGNFLHEPNWDAVLQLKQVIWPLIRKELPATELSIYGAYPSQKVLQINAPKEGFNIRGRAASALEVLRNSRVLVAPLRFGAGIKGKFIDAMMTGTPSVTTRVGAEAMAADLLWGGEIADDPEAFANAAVALYKEQEKWETAQLQGFEILHKRFSSKTFYIDFRARLESIKKNLQQHRTQNFTGEMLQHHLMQSTLYLSKYIEVKNKLQDRQNAKNAQ